MRHGPATKEIKEACATSPGGLPGKRRGRAQSSLIRDTVLTLPVLPTTLQKRGISEKSNHIGQIA